VVEAVTFFLVYRAVATSLPVSVIRQDVWKELDELHAPQTQYSWDDAKE